MPKDNRNPLPQNNRPAFGAAGLACACLIFFGGCFGKEQRIIPGEISDVDSHEIMVTTLRKIAQETSNDNIFVGDRATRSARINLKNIEEDSPKLEQWLKTYQLAKAELHQGNEAESIQHLAAALELIRGSTHEIKPEILRQFYFDTAVAYLRYGETQNCCRRNSPESCILPFRGAALHQDQEGSLRAIQWLSNLLSSTATDDPLHLASQWLLNLAYMTLGQYPDSVPPQFLIPGLDQVPDQEHGEAFPVWNNVAAKAGVNTFSLAGGTIADDFDNDGHPDLIVSSWDPRESLRVFWNRGDGTFVDGTQAARVAGILGGLNVVQTDYNNDGRLDVFVMRGGWLAGAGQHPNSLLRNNGDRTFTDVTITAGLAQQNWPTQAAAWADFDLDGDLDVYIGNESTDDLPAPSQLFRNEGDGTFVDVSASAGVTNDRLAKAVAWGDFDHDRDPDLYVSNYRGANRLYRNQGDGTFEDVAIQLNVAGPEASFPCWFCDVNNDGNLDLFVAAYAGGIAEIAMAKLGLPFDRQQTLPRMYMANAEHAFENRAEAMGLVHPTHPMGANFADLDSDGFLDFYLGTGWPEYHELMPNMLYRNTGKRFVDVTNAARVGHLQKGHGVAMADFDNDGDLDLFEQMGGFVPGDKFYDVLFQNPSTGQHWLKLKLVGTQSNRVAIGTRLHVQFTDGTEPRSIYRHINSGGSFGANPLESFIGLGKEPSNVRLEVFWPKTGRTDVYENLPVDQHMVIEEKVPSNQ